MTKCGGFRMTKCGGFRMTKCGGFRMTGWVLRSGRRLSVPGPYRREAAPDVLDLEHQLHQLDLVAVDVWIDGLLNLRLGDVVDRESQRDSGQRTCPGRVTTHNGFGEHL